MPKDTANSGQHSNPPVFDFHGTEVLEIVPASSTNMRTGDRQPNPFSKERLISAFVDPVWKDTTIMIKKIYYWSSPIPFIHIHIAQGLPRFKKVWRAVQSANPLIDSFKTIRPGLTMTRPSWTMWQGGRRPCSTPQACQHGKLNAAGNDWPWQISKTLVTKVMSSQKYRSQNVESLGENPKT